MSIQGKHITLRIPEPHDIDNLLAWENDPEYWHAGRSTIPFSRFDMEQFILQNQNDAFQQQQVRFIIGQNSDNIALGCVDLFELDALNRRAGTGILISREFQNKGYAGESLQLIEKYAFEHLWLQQLFAEVREDNTQSLELFLKAGFQQSGIKKAWIRTPQGFLDEIFLQKFNPAYHD